MIEQGLTLTVIGMTIVVVFLALLVVVMMALSGILRRVAGKERVKPDIHEQEIAAHGHPVMLVTGCREGRNRRCGKTRLKRIRKGPT